MEYHKIWNIQILANNVLGWNGHISILPNGVIHYKAKSLSVEIQPEDLAGVFGIVQQEYAKSIEKMTDAIVALKKLKEAK